MNRDNLKRAADALGRLEALEAALAALDKLPHEALPISFHGASEGGVERYGAETAIRVYYPRDLYAATLHDLIALEQAFLESVGIDL